MKLAQWIFFVFFWFGAVSQLPAEGSSFGPFRWPSPTRAKVVEKMVKKNLTMEMSYVVEIREKEGGGYLVTLSAFDFVSINGTPMTDDLKKQHEPVIQMFNAYPTLILNSAGEFVDLQDLEASLEATGDALDRINKNGGNRKKMEMMKDARFAGVFKEACAQFWYCWVELWLQFPLSPGETGKEEVELPLLSGSPVIKGVRKASHLGAIENSDLVHLKVETMSDDPEIAGKVTRELNDIDKHTGKAPMTESIPPLSVYKSFEVKINPTTLQPSWAKRYSETKVLAETAPEPKSQIESHEYLFEWQ